MNHILRVFMTIRKNLIAEIRKPLERIKLLSPFSPSSLPIQVKSNTRKNVCIYELYFPSDVAKRRRAKALFALLFASLDILHLVYVS